MRQYRLNRISRLKVSTTLVATLGIWALGAWVQAWPATAASPVVQHAVTMSAGQPQPARAIGGDTASAASGPGRAGPALDGFVWSSSLVPTGPVSSYYAFDTTGGVVTVNTVAGPPRGTYLAQFPGLGAMTRPTLDVTPYQTQETCGVAAAGAAKGGGWSVEVRCYSLSGTPQDGLFDLMLGQPSARPNGVLGFGIVDTASRSGRLTSAYSSSHQVSRFKRVGAGHYLVTMPGPATKGVTGTVKVTLFGSSGGDCEIGGWHGTATGQLVDVRCFAPSGAPRNSMFSVTYVRRNNLFGLNGATDAYAYASLPQAGRYQPATQFGSHRHAAVTIVRYGVGQYQVRLHGSGGPFGTNGGDVQISTVGSTDNHCRVLSWSGGANPVAYVSCVSNAGVQADSRFTIQWIVG